MPTESPSLWYPPTLAALSRFKHLHFTHNVNKEANSMCTAMSLQRLGYELLSVYVPISVAGGQGCRVGSLDKARQD